MKSYQKQWVFKPSICIALVAMFVFTTMSCNTESGGTSDSSGGSANSMTLTGQVYTFDENTYTFTPFTGSAEVTSDFWATAEQ